jgi:SAM-dependent methyltransferase
MKTEPTTERLIVENYQSNEETYLIYLIHIATYKYCLNLMSGKKVLDYGCGTGYGTALISDKCLQVTGIDISPEAIVHAKEHYNAPNLAYLKVEPAERGKTSTGWFFGFKLHLVVNDRGEILNVMLTPGNVDDRKPVPELVRNLFGKLVGDRGYISQPLFEELLSNFNLQFIVGIKSNMKNKLMPVFDKILLRKRAIIETIIDQLKNISQIEHSRHRSPINFLVNLVCGLIAYCRQPKKPSLGFHSPVYLLP